jgi:aminoglycoside 3-N-acetyltransferase
MPRPGVPRDRRPVGRGELLAGLDRLGVARGGILMVHASLRSLGWVVGGSQTVVEALLAHVGESGTVCAQASWEDIPFGLARWPRRWRRAYEAELPGFDPVRSAAAPYEGRLAERLRTWPGARRSANPATGIVAVGARADELTAGHRLDDGFGAGTPYARIAAAGQVLLLGAPLRSVSLLHHAEAIARAPKRRIAYRVPLAAGGGAVWHEVEEIDVWTSPYPYADVLPAGVPPIEALARLALDAGAGRAGRIGDAGAHLFDAPALVRVATEWIERRFG